MLSLTIVKLVILLFLGSLALVRRAQNEFYTGTEQNHLRGLFPFFGGNADHGRDGVDKGNILKVIDILQNNIKQWSFVESQLMEPNVNLGMPEIFIPLKHLTTTLEILGNIFFVQDDLAAAKESLERACPLMELLPESVQANHDYMASAEDVLGAGGVAVDPADINSFLWFGGGRNGNGPAQPTSLNIDGNRGAVSSGYAAGCFSLLRDVYIRLYGTTGGEDEPAAAIATNHAASVDAFPRSKYKSNADSTQEETDSATGISSSNGHRSLQYASQSAGHNSYRLPDGRPRELNLKYVLSRPQQMQQMKQKRPGERNRRHNANVSSEEEALLHQLKGGARSGKVTGTRMSMAATTTGSVYKEKSAASKAAQMVDPHVQQSGTNGHQGGIFDVEQKLRDLRSPYQHLRSEMADAQSVGAAEFEQNNVHVHSQDIPHHSDRRGMGLGLSADSATTAGKRGEASVRGFKGSALNSISGAEITLQGVATSIIADDLEVLLRKFVRASRKGRRELAKLAAKYFDELDINYPNMDYNEYAANMDVGQAYLEVMTRVVDEGFDFIAPELDSAWARALEDDQEEQLVEDSFGILKPSTGTPSRAALSSKRLGELDTGKADEAIIASLENDWGLTFRSAGYNDGDKVAKTSSTPSVSKAAKKKMKKTSEASVPKLTMAEKNRLLVLYAFEIVHSDPSDLFDLGLGFTQGIFANDRTRRGVSSSAPAVVPRDSLHETADYLRSALKGGLLGGADDAHKRLFPFDSLSDSSLAEEATYDQLQMKHLTEQHLRDLLMGEGGAEAYLAAKSAAIRKKSVASVNSGGSAAEGATKSNSRRRRQQRHANAGEGEYSVSSEGGSIGIHQRRARDPGDVEGGNDLFDEVAGATVGILSASSLRASVPSLGQDGTDWTLSIFLLFMMLTAAVVYTANQEAARKRMTTGRNRLRHGGNALGGGGKKSGGAWPCGSGIVDFMYAQLGGVGGAPGVNATADWDDSVPSSAGASVGLEADASAVPTKQPNGLASSNLFVSASSSLNVFLGGMKRSAGQDAWAPGAAAQGESAKTSIVGVSKAKHGRDSASQQELSVPAASASAVKGGQQSTSSSEGDKAGARASLFGDLFSLIKPTPSSTSAAGTVDATNVPVGPVIPSTSVTVAKAEGAAKRKEAAVVEVAKVTGAGKGKTRKGNQKEPIKPVSPSGTIKSNSNVAGLTKSVASSESLNSITSTSSSDNKEGSKGNNIESTQFLPPVVMNNRRVSWAGLLPTTTTTDAALDCEEGYDGDWAAAKKKGGRKHASTAAAATDGESGAAASRSTQKDSSAQRSPSKPSLARQPTALTSATGATNSSKHLGTMRSFSGHTSTSSTTLSSRNNRSIPTSVSNSVAAVETSQSAVSAVGPDRPPTRTDSVVHSTATNYQNQSVDLLDRWTLSALGPVGAAPTRPPVYAPPGLSASHQPSPKRTGFPESGSTTALPVQSHSRTSADMPTSSLSGAFGFSHFNSFPSSTYAAPTSLWSDPLSLGNNSLSGADSNVPLSSQTSMSEEGYAVDFESDGYLGDLVSFLDSSPRASPQPQPRSLVSSVPTPIYDRDNSAYTYGAGVYGEAQYGVTEDGYYTDQTATMESYYQQQHEQYAAANGHYGYNNEVEESTSLWGTRQQQRDSGGHDLAASITLEASSVYGLSPDAPSFKPSTQRRIESLQPMSFPVPSGVDFRNHLLGENNGALFPTGASLASSQSPSTSGLFNSDDFYESILIDSILGGEDQKKQGSVVGSNNF